MHVELTFIFGGVKLVLSYAFEGSQCSNGGVGVFLNSNSERDCMGVNTLWILICNELLLFHNKKILLIDHF